MDAIENNMVCMPAQQTLNYPLATYKDLSPMLNPGDKTPARGLTEFEIHILKWIHTKDREANESKLNFWLLWLSSPAKFNPYRTQIRNIATYPVSTQGKTPYPLVGKTLP